MVELRTRKREMRGDWINHQEKLGHKGMLGATQYTVPDTAGASPNPACKYTDTRSSQTNQANHTPGFSCLLVSSISFLSLSLISPILVHNSTIITEYKVKSSLSISPCYDHELTLCTAYTESTASTQDCLSSHHSYDCKLTPDCNFRHASLHHRPPSASSPWELKDTLTFPGLRVLTN